MRKRNEHTLRQPLNACIALALLLNVGPACAQHVKSVYDDKNLFQESASASAGASVHSWSIGGVRLGQQTYPMTVTMPASERVLFSLAAVPASVQQGDAAIAGVPETRVSVSAVLPGDQLWVTGSVSVPTGVTRLSQVQTELAATLAQPALGYRMPSMGHGWDATLGCAYASSVARGVVFGCGAAASFKGSYEPAAPAESYTMRYDPGNELAANIGIDLRDGVKTNRFSADYTVTYYLPDRINGDVFFRSGIKAAFVLVGSHVAPLGVHTLQVRAELRARNVSTINGVEEESPAARQYAVRYSLTLPLREKVSLTASAEAKAMSSDEFPVNGEVLTTGGGTVGTLSAECRWAIARWCMLSSELGFGVGSITFMNSDRHAVGFDAGAGLKFLF